MFRTQIYLTQYEREKLLFLSQEFGKHQSALIREAIDLFIENKLMFKRKKHHALRAASGLWADRDDLPNVDELRKEFNRQDNLDE